jgi:nucleoside-diphosphate-sugar epimerase
VYGLQENKPLKETVSLCPSSPYAVSKAAADLYLQMMFNTFDLHGSIMRPANSYGRKFDASFVIEYLVTQMLKGETVYIGAPDSVRDYMYVDDHVAAYLLAMKKGEADREIFNVGTGVGVSNHELAELIAKKTKFDVKKIRLGSYPPGYPYRPLASDQPYIVLDSTKIRKILHWSPTVSLDEGIDRVIAYFKKQYRPS